MDLHWLPRHTEWNQALRRVRALPAQDAVPQLVQLANCSLDFLQTARIGAVLSSFGAEGLSHLNRCPPLKLALLGSSTLTHLIPAIRVAALRRGFAVEIYVGPYGTYRQELADSSSGLYRFGPDVVLMALDAHHLVAGECPSVEQAIDRMRSCWQLAKEQLHATVIQQTVLPVFHPVIGSNEHRYEMSPHTLVQRINHELRVQSEAEGVFLLSVDHLAQMDGVAAWFNHALWHRSKQEIHLAMTPVYGDHAGRILAALRGISSKCLVLDLDNTLWGGVAGDDGIEGILLGQGHAVGEAYVSLQNYVKSLADRGVILAVCSKNDIANALLPFERHPEMVLRPGDISHFVANWEDKATNLRRIAHALDIGLDSLVFVDDNPFERNLVRQELPMVQVPEMPDDPAMYEVTLAAAGYFEALSITSEDRQRVKLYKENSDRRRLQETSTDMDGYLRSLNMELTWSAFDDASISRVVQLINKSNQFNLTTRRYTQEQVIDLVGNLSVITLQLRLKDIFGDNGLIAVVIGRPQDSETLEIDTWLMSCRVLGRHIEEVTLNLIVEQARRREFRKIAGRYLPTAKNAMVRDHYARLGFQEEVVAGQTGSRWIICIDDYMDRVSFAKTVEIESQRMGGMIDSRTDLHEAH